MQIMKITSFGGPKRNLCRQIGGSVGGFKYPRRDLNVKGDHLIPYCNQTLVCFFLSYSQFNFQYLLGIFIQKRIQHLLNLHLNSLNVGILVSKLTSGNSDHSISYLWIENEYPQENSFPIAIRKLFFQRGSNDKKWTTIQMVAT